GSSEKTMTGCVQLALLPLASVAVHITEVGPSGKRLGALLVRLAMAQLSPVSGVPNSTSVAQHWPAGITTMTSSGQVSVGGWLSTTITRWVQTVELPFTSVTVHTTKLVPSRKLPGALLTTLATVQLSEVIGLPNTTPLAEHWPG